MNSVKEQPRKPQTRFEFKYILNPAKARAALGIVERIMDLDGVLKQKKAYTVTSLYFDTPQLSDYYDKSGGFTERKKVRARIYDPFWNNISSVWLETKKKHDMAFQKTRALVSREEWADILERRYTRLLTKERKPKDQAGLEDFLWYTLQEGRRPLIFVRYKRTPFVFEDDEALRVTFDEHIECARASDLSRPTFTDLVTNNTILEVKFSTRLPAWFHSMIKKLDIQRTSFSKYGRSVDALYKHNPLPR